MNHSLKRIWLMYRPKEHGLTVMTLQVLVLGLAFAVQRASVFWLAAGLLLLAPWIREAQRLYLHGRDNARDLLVMYALAGALLLPMVLQRPDRVPFVWLLVFVMVLDLVFQATRTMRTWYAEMFGVVGLMLFLVFLLELGGTGWAALPRVVFGFWAVGTLAVLAVRYQRARKEGEHPSPWPMVAMSLLGTAVSPLLLPLPAAVFLALLLWSKTLLTLYWLPTPRTRRDFKRLGWVETTLTTVFLVGWIAMKPLLLGGGF
ncbi:MAG: hypothetical protein L3J76_04515 [Candidatus Hydrothermae bacterium]|nr:hypothetical protein [Candidatus Hydrothermae bacterium]